MERKKEYTSVEEVFAALSEEIREHSLRVEKYADLIFMELCAAEEYTLNIHSRVRLKAENRSLIRLAARYHDLGKAPVPDVYQWNDPDYTPEEYALYCRHCLAGDELVHEIYREQKGVVPMQVDIICEGAAYHHENWDGTGFPHGRREEHIPVVGRIIAVADALDHLLMTTRTETPVHTAMELMMQESATRYDPVIMGLLYDAQPKIERIFSLYQEESLTIPQAFRVIRRKVKRPMWLEYRPIADLRDRKAVSVEATMRFRRGKDTVGFSEAEPLLRKSKRMWDAGLCFLVEASDMARRMHNCAVGGAYVAVPLVPGFLKKKGAATTVERVLADTEGDPASLGLILLAKDVTMPSPLVIENCAKFRAMGCALICKGVTVDAVEPEALVRLGITHLYLTPEDVQTLNEHSEKCKALSVAGITLVGDGVDKHRLITALTVNEIHLGAGDLLGEYTNEDTFILGELALSQRR